MKENTKPQETKKSATRETVEFLTPIIIALVIAILLKAFVFANAVVPTGSMLNTIQKKDHVIASKLSYITEDPQRYDIIIFKFPDDYYDNDTTTYYVKRIIGLPGETVQIINGKAYVTKADGTTVETDDSFITNCTPVGDFGPYVVPEDSYFVMGDNRNDSLDSRYWHHTFVDKDLILGKVKFRYLPIKTAGKIE